MHPADRVQEALRLATLGLTQAEIAQRTGVPRRTVWDWLNGRIPPSADPSRSCQRCGWGVHRFAELPTLYTYLLGLYLGDGCLSAYPRGVFRLRVTLDLLYPEIVHECEEAMEETIGRSRVARVLRMGSQKETPTHVDVSSYSKAWPCLLPQHGPGKKHHRRIELTDWQEAIIQQDPRLLLRGLIHSDGCRAINTGTNWRHPRYSFYNYSDDILGIFVAGCEQLGLHYTRAPHVVYVSRKADVARMDEFIGPKR